MARMQVFFYVPYACSLTMLIDGRYQLQFDSENFKAVEDWANQVVHEAAEQVNNQKRSKAPVTVKPRVGAAPHLPKPPQPLKPAPIAATIIAAPPVDPIIVDSEETTDDLPADAIEAASREAAEQAVEDMTAAELPTDDIVAQACEKIPGGIKVFVQQAIMRKMSPEDLAQYVLETPDSDLAQELMLPVGNSGINGQAHSVSSA